MATRKLLGKVIAQARASHTGRDGIYSSMIQVISSLFQMDLQQVVFL